jgi:hypothetical protein
VKVYDLVAGKEIDLPSTGIASGRYRLTHACLLNGEVKLPQGAILWRSGDGSGSLTPEDQPNIRVLIRFVHVPVQSTAGSVVDLSIAAVVDSWSPAADVSQLPSPLLPLVLRDRMNLIDPEPEMERALAKGQWDEISRRPRLDMHYVPEAVPVARAKRVQASAIEYLSQHSELWARRNISGVVPAKVLARVSEDDYAIYENIVFARLLDGCARWLNGRISDVRKIADGQSKALEFEKGDERHRLLRERICALWGKDWFRDAEDTQATREPLKRLEQMRSHVERLRRTGVYKRVPRSAKVPLALRPTNIFQYDKRYRELRPLWDAMAKANTRDQISESVRYQTLTARQAAFLSYVLLLILHALRDMGATKLGSNGFQHRVGPWDLHIDTEDSGEVRINVFACGKLLRSRTLVLLLTREDDVVCRDPRRSLFYAEDLMVGGASNEGDQYPRILNPLQFFGVERVRKIIEHDLGDILLNQYPPIVGRIPATARDKLICGAAGVFRPHDGGVVVLPSAKSSVQGAVKLISEVCTALPDKEAELQYAIGLGQWLMRCRACGANADTQDMRAEERSLRLICPTCRLKTTINTSPARSMKSHFMDGYAGFEFCGGVEIQLPESDGL